MARKQIKDLARRLELLEPLSDALPYAVYDRSGRILMASDNFLIKSGRTRETLFRASIHEITVPHISGSEQRLRAFLSHQPHRNCFTTDAVLLYHRMTSDSHLQFSREVRNGLQATFMVRELDSRRLLLILHDKGRVISRQMGFLSADLMVTVDHQRKILGMSDSAINLCDELSPRLFGEPIDRLFPRGAFMKALRQQRATMRNMRRKAAAHHTGWEPIHHSDFTSPHSLKSWILSSEDRIRCTDEGLWLGPRIGGAVRLTLKDYPILPDYDYRWEVRLRIEPDIGIGCFFNGHSLAGDSHRATPENWGYLASYFRRTSTNYSQMRLKRCGAVITGKSAALGKVSDSLRFSVEKAGGVFRFAAANGFRFECVDTQYSRFDGYSLTGLVVSAMPVTLIEATLFRRTGAFAGPQPPVPQFDLRFRTKPDEIYEARFFERSGPAAGKKAIIDVYLRNVTELRRAQSTNRELMEQKSRTLQQLNDELALAADVLNGLLPKRFPDIPGLHFHSYFKPSGHVGGDLFDVFTADADRVAILMYDVSGHGVPAALVSVMTRTLFQKHYHAGISAIELLEKVNHDLYRDMPGRSFVTLFFGLLDHKKRELCYAGAGFTTPVAVSGNSLLMLNTKGIPLGIQEKITSREYRVSLNGPSKLLLFTDGLYEIFNADDEFYGPKRMVEFVKQNAALPVGALIDAVVGEHSRFTTGVAQRDDVSILGLDIDAA